MNIKTRQDTYLAVVSVHSQHVGLGHSDNDLTQNLCTRIEQTVNLQHVYLTPSSELTSALPMLQQIHMEPRRKSLERAEI
jgi:hypothetical protein